ncbi:DEAD/DEAH box helicase, partial [Streptomyces altiplanensis]
ITPHTAQVRSGDAELTRITGAQAPSGIPVTISSPVSERPRRSASSQRGRRSAPAQSRRRAYGSGGGSSSSASRGSAA